MSRVLVENGALSLVAQHLGTPCSVALISDTNVLPRYGKAVGSALMEAGFHVHTHAIPAGEQHKNLQTYGDILGFLAAAQLTRSDLVLALGGGVVGDMAGFAAATYLRGLRLAMLPTTLLSQVDASIGGKTAIDLPQGKNLAGAFYQPELVLADPETLSTLPEREYRSGLAEVVKYGVSLDAELFDLLPYDLQEQEGIIRRCAELKQRIVAGDEKDKGQRQLLNFGHTFGHAVEHLSGYSLSHGEAVAIGMCIIARASARRGHCGKEAAGRLHNMLHLLGLPTGTDMEAEAIFDVVKSDKKRQGDQITLVLLHGIGDARLHKMPLSEAKAYLEAGLRA